MYVKNIFKNTLSIALLSSILLIASCGVDDTPDDGNEPIVAQGLLVLNEGGFQKGNSSLAFVNLETNAVETSLYEAANGKLLGDVGQSFGIYNNLLYVVLNNSGEIKVINPVTFQEITSIGGFTAPRYITPVGNNRAYVGDLFAGKISTVDFSTNTLTGEIALKGMTEKMAVSGNNVFVTNKANNHVFVIDAHSDAVTDSILIGGNSDEIFNLNSKIVAIRNANTDSEIKPAFVTINPSDLSIESTIEFEAAATMWEASAVQYNNSIYFLHEGAVMKFDGAAVSKVFDYQEGISAYNMAIYEDLVYVTDAKDYSATGAVLQYNMSGELLNTYATGIIPTAIMRFEK